MRWVRGTVQGAAARKHPEYMYLKPILVPLDIFQLDPERLRASDEYPRSVNPPSLQALPAKELADYCVTAGPEDAAGQCKVQVVLLPNEHTCAKKPKIIFQAWVSPLDTIQSASTERLLDEIVKRAFSESPRT